MPPSNFLKFGNYRFDVFFRDGIGLATCIAVRPPPVFIARLVGIEAGL